MTNGEKIKETFPDIKIITQYDNPFGDTFMVFTLNNEKMEVNLDWWNAEYKEPTTRNCFGCKYTKDNHRAGTEECHLCMWENQYTPATKNDLGVDCISRKQAIEEADKLTLETGYDNEKVEEMLRDLPSVTPQEPRCKECKWWKDSDGKYRRGCGAESQCPINTHAVYCGEGYCYMFSPKVDMREVEE